MARAQEFLFTLDDPRAVGFAERTLGASRVSIMGRTAVNLLSHYDRVFIERAQAGCEFRFLFIDPNSKASEYVYGGNRDVYLANMRVAASHMRSLRQRMESRLQVRAMDHAPTMSLLIVEKSAGPTTLQVQLYFLHSRLGSDRPLFQVLSGDKWHQCFLEEFNELWTSARTWDETEILSQS